MAELAGNVATVALILLWAVCLVQIFRNPIQTANPGLVQFSAALILTLLAAIVWLAVNWLARFDFGGCA